MTIHEAAEGAVKAWLEIPEGIRRRLGTGFGSDQGLNLRVRLTLLADALAIYAVHPERRAEYPEPRSGLGDEFSLSGPLTEIPLAEIVVRSDGGPWAVHNQPCAVCGARTAILDLNEGVMRPCGPCTSMGWLLVKGTPPMLVWHRRIKRNVRHWWRRMRR